MLWRTLDELERAVSERDTVQAIACLQWMIPSYTPSIVALRSARVRMNQAVGA